MNEFSAETNTTPPKSTPETRSVPEKLSDEQMGELISAVGNHEAKGLTLALMEDESIYSQNPLWGKIINAQGKNPGWKINNRGPFNYCEETFAPIGLVAREAFNSDGTVWGYQITKLGKNIGIPLAGHLLAFSEKHNISLIELFGPTHSSSKEEKRSPITKWQILQELVTNPTLPIRETDLAKSLGEKNLVALHQHLQTLLTIEFLTYKSVSASAGEKISRFMLSEYSPENAPEHPLYPLLTKLIYDIFKENQKKTLTYQDLLNTLSQIPEQNKTNRTTLTAVLSFLRNNAYITHEGKFYKDNYSEITMDDNQRILAAELVEVLDRIQDRDPEFLQKGTQLAQQIIANPQRVAGLMQRAKEKSPGANRVSPNERKQQIRSIIALHPNSSVHDIQEKLAQQEITLSTNRISQLVRGDEFVQVTTKGSLNLYSIKES